MPECRKSLRRFSHFSLQIGSTNKLHTRLQAIVWYVESRFRQALIKISRADHKQQQWMQWLLANEVVRLGLSKHYG